MHRATPVNSSFRAFSAGGARALLKKIGDGSIVDDLKNVQQIGVSMMKGEARGGVEHAQSYGLTSVPYDPDEGKDGKPGLGPETFIQFMGGNRSFPSAGPIDDRRHRMKGLEKGDVCLFSGKEGGQNLHLNGIGTFLNTFPGKKLRMQIVEKVKQATGQGGATFAEGDAAGGGEAKEELGQKPNYKNPATAYFEVDDAGTTSVNKMHSMKLPDGTAVHVADGKVYLGGEPDSGTFRRVMCEGLVLSVNVYAKVG